MSNLDWRHLVAAMVGAGLSYIVPGFPWGSVLAQFGF